MSVLEAPRKIYIASKTLNRLTQILAILSKYGLSYLVSQFGLQKYLPVKSRMKLKPFEKSLPERLKLAFEELGPTFVKLGQFISMREDLFTEDWSVAMKQLQDDVNPVSFTEIKKILVDDGIWDSFDKIDEVPIASASIAQVHMGYLKSGQKVVLKVQRPLVKEIVDQDALVLEFIAKHIEKQFPDLKTFNITQFIEEFIVSLKNELDFKMEAGYMEKIAKYASNDAFVKIPYVYPHLSNQRVIVEEYIEGTAFTKANNLSSEQKSKILKGGMRTLYRMILKDGLFHADLHWGNLFIIENNCIAMIDFGSVGSLSVANRRLLVSMINHLVKEEYEAVVLDFMEMAGQYGGVNTAHLASNLRTTLSPWLGLEFDRVNHGKVLMKATRLAAQNNIQIPSDWYVVFKALANVESMAKFLDPKFNIIEEMKSMGTEIFKDQIRWQDILEQLAMNSHSFIDLLRLLPREIKWYLKFMESNQYKVPINVLHGKEQNEIFYNLGSAFLYCVIGIFITSVGLILREEINFYLCVSILITGLLFVARSLFFIKKRD